MITEVANTEKLNPIKVKEEGNMPSSPPSSTSSTSSTNVSKHSAQQSQAENQHHETRNKNQDVKDNIQKDRYAKKSGLEKQITSLTNAMYKLNRELIFKVDKRINRNYISIIDKKTKEVIKEVPPKEIRSFMAKLDQISKSGKSNGNIRNLMLNLEV